MAESANSEIQELRTRLEASRWNIHHGLHQLEDKLNVSRRLRSEFKEHPVKWVAVSAGVGLVAAKLLPLLLGGRKRSWFGKMVSPLVRAAAVAAMPLLATKASEWMSQRGISIPGLVPSPNTIAASPNPVPPPSSDKG